MKHLDASNGFIEAKFFSSYTEIRIAQFKFYHTIKRVKVELKLHS